MTITVKARNRTVAKAMARAVATAQGFTVVGIGRVASVPRAEGWSRFVTFAVTVNVARFAR